MQIQRGGGSRPLYLEVSGGYHDTDALRLTLSHLMQGEYESGRRLSRAWGSFE
jgi:hypothetical protein